MLSPFKPPDLNVLNIRHGGLLGRQSVALIAGVEHHERESVAHTVALLWRGEEPWLGEVLNWSSGSICVATKPKQAAVVIGEEGEFVAFDASDFVEGRVDKDATFSSVQTIDGHAIAVGSTGAVLCYEGGERWRDLSVVELADYDLEAATGTALDKIYLFGWDGAVAIQSRGAAQALPGLTNLVLVSACCAADGFIYACGQRGTLLRGKDSQWEVIDHGYTSEDFWDVRSFQGRVFVTSSRFLYEVDKDQLRRVRFEEDTPGSFYKLTSLSDDVLMSIGRKDVMLYDGTEWTRLL